MRKKRRTKRWPGRLKRRLAGAGAAALCLTALLDLMASPTYSLFTGSSVITGSITANSSFWDKSSLAFAGEEGGCSQIQATLWNKGANMEGPSTYRVYRSEKGNPQKGDLVSEGVVPVLLANEKLIITYQPNRAPGRYMFEAFQRPGHPGQGVLWSGSILVGCNAREGVMAQEPEDATVTGDTYGQEGKGAPAVPVESPAALTEQEKQEQGLPEEANTEGLNHADGQEDHETQAGKETDQYAP